MAEILDMSILKDFVDMATQEFKPALQKELDNQKKNIDKIISMTDILLSQISNSTNSPLIKYKKKVELSDNVQINNLNVMADITKLYYLLRTLLTGEEISFLETIQGHLKVINQSDWVSNLSVSTSKKEQTIILLKSKLKNLGTLLNESSILTSFSQNNLEDYWEKIKQAGNFNWKTDPHIKISSDEDGTTYRKMAYDDYVYARFSGGTSHAKSLFYENTTNYNLGWLQEELGRMFEIMGKTDDKFKQQLFLSALKGEHPVGVLLAGMQRNNVPGMVEGDFKTYGEEGKINWIQSKGDNPQVVSFLQAYNTILDIKNYLLDLQSSINNNSLDNDIDNLSDKFYGLFSSELENIDTKLLNEIKKRLPLLNET